MTARRNIRDRFLERRHQSEMDRDWYDTRARAALEALFTTEAESG